MAEGTQERTVFAQLLRHYRIRAGLTQEGLAEIVTNDISRPGGLTEKGIQALESGTRRTPRRDTVEKLADALDLTDDERTRFRREGDKLRVKRNKSNDTPDIALTPSGDASQYLPRPSPADAIAPEAVEQAADESSFPPLPEHFVGRERELGWLTDRLRRGITTGITAVKGIGGVGKTSLATKAVEILQAEGQYIGTARFVMCQGKTDPFQVICDVLRRFEPQRLIPSGATDGQLRDTACQLLRNKRVLVVLDNIEPGLDIERVVAPLQAAKATILLTSRGYLSAGECLDLQLLATDEARKLFCLYLDKTIDDLVENEPAAVTRIVENLGNHTLAVKVVALYARSTRRSLHVLADELKTPFEVEKITESINGIFQRSFEALSPEAQQVFAAFGAFATVEFSRNAAKALAKALGHTHPGACVDSLIEYGLVDPSELHGLLQESDSERLQLHPLLQAFAIEQLTRFPNEFDGNARQMIAAYYADYASRPQRVSLWPDDRNITEALIYAYDNHQHELVARICLGMHLFWRDYGRATETEMFVAWGIAAAEEYAAAAYSEDAYRALATLRLAHARFLRLTGKLDEAEHLAREALSTFKGAGNPHGTGAAYVVLGNIARDKGKYQQARVSLRRALTIYQSEEARDLGGEGLALCFLGQASQRLGEIEISDRELEQSIKISEKTNDQWCLGLARLLLGNNLKQLGRFHEAEALYRGVLEFYRFVDSRRSIGVALSSLGEIALRLGNLTEAEGYLLESLKARRTSRDLRGEAVDATFLGELTAIQERYAASSRYFKEALKNWQEVHDPRGQGWVLAEQARFALTHGQLDDANSLLARSLKLLRTVGDKRAIAINYCISAELALRRGENEFADDQLRQAEALAIEVQDRPEQAHIKRAHGLLAAARGNPDRAEACYRASLSIASELGIRREMAQAQELLGRLLAERQDLFEGRQLLAQAEENYSHLGVPAATRVREIMVQLGGAAGD